MYFPEEVDPTTIHVDHPSRVREFLSEASAIAGKEAQRLDCYMMVYHEDGDEIRIKSVNRKDFEDSAFQCPRMADKAYEDSQGSPRPLPSIIGLPDGRSVISKPSLCEHCAFYLTLKTTGSCIKKQFTPLLGK